MLSAQSLLQILADGKYHSGTDLGVRFGVSRAAIGKTIHKIEQNYGLSLFAVRGKGYRLQQALELLDENVIRQKLMEQTSEQLNQFEIFFDIDSTNRYLNNKSIEGASSGYLVLAEQQTKGIGRRGREWMSPFGSNLYLSLLWRFPYGAAQLGCLSLFIAVAIVRALQKAGVKDAGVKWPNDIYWKNKKLAGILLEMRGELSGPSAVVIGIGLNINMPASSIEANNIDQPWIDLQTILGQKVERNEFTAFVIDALFDVLNNIPDEQNKLLKVWQQMDILKEQNVDVIFADKKISGKALGINRDGALIVHHDGKDIVCHSGDVSIRPGLNDD
ncbi:MAG: bifunctional biotin--[acetyl-CoA-carboxylase] ligase/biotin operon repressor BirA [Gammaproteobacteria bacterium]|nr:bifunctional biotin--[acetyl-CoA-carboxylase] ligase/biotin operon repressor BirA [Gammaproteobacteria bacterium]